MGSFVNALVWRLHEDRDFINERSECVHCHHQLVFYDLVPVLSWVLLMGKCRYCHKKISWHYPLIELATAALFVFSYLYWPFDLASGAGLVSFILWLFVCVIFMALISYDAFWKILPDKLVVPLTGLATFFGLIRVFSIEQLPVASAYLDLIGGVLVIAGLYFVLHWYSKGRWIGFGDVKLGISLGLILGFQESLLALFLANFIGLLFILPGMILGKIHSKSKIPFGPFLIVGCIISFLLGSKIIDWYFSIILG